MALSPELPQLQRSHAHIPGLSCNIRASRVGPNYDDKLSVADLAPTFPDSRAIFGLMAAGSAELRWQNCLDPLHNIEPVYQVVDVIELVCLKNEYFAHFV